MTTTPPKLIKGKRYAGIPADGWNAFADMHRQFQAVRSLQTTTVGGSQGAALSIAIQNKTGADLTNDFPIVRLTDPIVDPVAVTKAKFRGVQMQAAKPNTEAANFAIVQGPVKADRFQTATITGAAFALVDITSTSHTKAAATANDTDQLTSHETDGVTILWKPPGTGPKICIVLIGIAAGGDAGVRYALLTGNCPAATMDGVAKEVIPGKSTAAICVILKWNDDKSKLVEDTDIGTLKCWNVGRDAIVRASSDEPIPLRGVLFTTGDPEETVFVVAPEDQRSLDGYNRAKDQSIGHDAGNAIEMQDDVECSTP